MLTDNQQIERVYSGYNPKFVQRVRAKRQAEKDRKAMERSLERHRSRQAHTTPSRRDKGHKVGSRRFMREVRRQEREQERLAVISMIEANPGMTFKAVARRFGKCAETVSAIWREHSEEKAPEPFDDDAISCPADVIAAVASRRCVPIEVIKGPSTARRATAARDEAICEVYKRFYKPYERSLPWIGRMFNRDHTAILYALRKAGVHKPVDPKERNK